MQCPKCRAMQRGSALRCWKCGLDLTRPFVPEGAAAGAGVVTTQAGVGGPESATAASPERLGPAPRGWLARTFDPRITTEELERAARGYDQLPWAESYRKPAGLGLLPLALGLGLVQRVLAAYLVPSMSMSITTARGHAFIDQMYQLAFAVEILGWAAIGVLVLALFVYRGNQWAIALGAVAWLVAIGWLFSATFPANLQYAPAYLPFLLPLYVELVLLWKAERVALARAEFVWNRQTAHDART